ncbi:UNKNOWN [Stylonychia lemnae]|uniref:Uncharacterized protein n=1 Tax=Stylonychia lemnae TaxID=5949 RepID=A0A078A9F4_STYLE|nr:UNKNOWN [Stylonychia lemnae]|eukprot:CDW78491.1 UNKNOWN [Stylonychia lemnae]
MKLHKAQRLEPAAVLIIIELYKDVLRSAQIISFVDLSASISPSSPIQVGNSTQTS